MLAANGACHAARARALVVNAQLLWRERRGLRERAALEVARRQSAKAIERQKVRRRSQLAVFSCRRTKRPLRQVAAQFGERLRLGPLAALRAAHRDRLDVLAAEDGAAATAPGMSSVVRDRGVTDRALPGRANRSNAVVRPQPRSQLLFSLVTRSAKDLVSRVQSNLPIVNDEDGPCGGAADNDDGVAATALAGHRESAAGQRVIEPVGQRTSRDDGKLGGGGEGTTDEWTEDKDERCFRRQRIGRGSALVEEQSRAKSAASDVLPEHGIGQRHASGAAAGDIDTQVAAVISERHMDLGLPAHVR